MGPLIPLESEKYLHIIQFVLLRSPVPVVAGLTARWRISHSWRFSAFWTSRSRQAELLRTRHRYFPTLLRGMIPCAHYVSAEEMPNDQNRARSDYVFHRPLSRRRWRHRLWPARRATRDQNCLSLSGELFGVGQVGRRAQEITKGTCSEVGGFGSSGYDAQADAFRSSRRPARTAAPHRGRPRHKPA
jgi:hypothetical protein